MAPQLDGSAPIPADGWTFFRDNIFRFHPSRLIRPVVFFKGRSIRPLPVPKATDFPPRLEPLQWCAIAGTIYFAVDHHHLPADYKLSYAALPTGITLYQVQQVVIRHLTIRGYQADGIAAAAGARDVVLEKVTCTANGQGGVSVGGSGPGGDRNVQALWQRPVAVADRGRFRDPLAGQLASQRHSPRVGRSGRQGLPGHPAD